MAQNRGIVVCLHMPPALRRALIDRYTVPNPAYLEAATVYVHLAAARALYKALRWARATTVDPFADARPAPDKTPAWDKRQPYSPTEVTTLLDHTSGEYNGYNGPKVR